MTSAGNFHDKEKEDELKKFLDSLNIPKGRDEKAVERQKLDPFIKKNLESGTEKELYEPTKTYGPSPSYPPRDMNLKYSSSQVSGESPDMSVRRPDIKVSKEVLEKLISDPSLMESYMRLKYKSSDISTSASTPASDLYGFERRFSPVYSSPTTGSNIVAGLVAFLVIVGIIVLVVVLLLKFLF